MARAVQSVDVLRFQLAEALYERAFVVCKPHPCSGLEGWRISARGWILGQLSDSGKTTSGDAHQRPRAPSIFMAPAGSADSGTGGIHAPGSSGADQDVTRQAINNMGMSVALDIEARQAAAVKVAEEQALVRKAQAGDRLAFESLVRRFDREVLRLALNLVHRPEDARDIYQESFLRVYKNLHRFRFECSFYTWLYRIVTNVALDHLRRRTSRREDQAPVPEDAEGGTRDFFDRQPEQRAGANPERSLLGQELGEQIASALNRLSPRERMVFEMKHYQGLKLRAIGDMLGTSEETVKNSLFRATRKLRASLESMR
jgi:RNA polymerase sigma-70 factor (ECF subfamily)